MCSLGRSWYFEWVLCWFPLVYPQPQVSQSRLSPSHQLQYKDTIDCSQHKGKMIHQHPHLRDGELRQKEIKWNI